MKDEPRKQAGPGPRQWLAELSGAFAQTFTPLMLDILAKATPANLSLEARALGPSLVVLGTVFAFGSVSGAHSNPAVTVAFALRRAFPWRWVPGYVVSQFLGGAVAALVARGFEAERCALGMTLPEQGVPAAVAMEVLGTFFIVVVVLATAKRHRLLGPFAAIPVAATMAPMRMIGSAFSGPSLNPARSLGPAWVCGNGEGSWLYTLAPVLGGVLAVLFVTFLRGPANKEEVEAAEGE